VLLYCAIKTIFSFHANKSSYVTYFWRLLPRIQRMIKQKLSLLFYLLIIFQVVGWASFILLGRDTLFFFINGANTTSILPEFFWFMTLFGEWPLIVFTLIFIFIKHKKHIIQAALLFVSCGLLTYLFKFIIFGKTPRPAAYFIDNSNLYLSPYLSTNYWHSFPSGHTFMAFTGFLFLSYFAKKQGLKILCFVLALLVGISRIYNGQHFPEDVLLGSLLGAILSYLIYTFVPTYHLKSVSKQQ